MARTSRCSNPAGAPYLWVDAVEQNHPSILRYEEHFRSMLRTLRAITLGEIEELFEAASRGEIVDSADNYTPLKPIRTHPEIWELRHSYPAKYRFYHGEPVENPQQLVKLHFHVKDSAGKQQKEIDHAVKVYNSRT